MKFIRVIEQSSGAEIYININHIICFSKLDDQTMSLGVIEFGQPLTITHEIEDFKERVIFLNKNKDGII